MGKGQGQGVTLKQKTHGKKKKTDAYSKKIWINAQAPNVFKSQVFGKTPVNKTFGTTTTESYLNGRVFEANASDLMGIDENQGHILFRLKGGLAQGDKVLTTFYGMRITKDKEGSIVRKNRSLIQTNCEVKTVDGYTLRIFVMCTTKRRRQQIKKTCYLFDSQRRKIMEKIRETVTKVVSKCDVSKLVDYILNRSIEDECEKHCSCIFPINQTQISKVKVIKEPKMATDQILRLHTEKKAEKVDN